MPEYTRALDVVKLKKPFKNHSPRPQSARRLLRTYDLSSRGQPAPRTNYPASVPLIIRTYTSPSQNLKPHSRFCHRGFNQHCNRIRYGIFRLNRWPDSRTAVIFDCNIFIPITNYYGRVKVQLLNYCEKFFPNGTCLITTICLTASVAQWIVSRTYNATGTAVVLGSNLGSDQKFVT